MSHSFAHGFYMPEGADPYDMVVKRDDYPTTLAGAILALTDAEFCDLCERADTHPDDELAWHECMTWVRETVNAVACGPKRTRVYIDEECTESVDVYDAHEALRLRTGDIAL